MMSMTSSRELLQRVVAGAGKVGLRAVVVHREPAADVEAAHRRPFLDQRRVDAAGLVQSLLDAADVRDLGADVVVQQLEAVDHAACLELVDRVDDLGRGQAEHRAVAARLVPHALGARGELCAQADARLDVEAGRAVEELADLAGPLDHDDHLQPELEPVQRQVDELAVLVAVADDQGFGVVHVGERDGELGLAAGLQAVVVLAAELADFLYDLLLLVDLDRVHAPVEALVLELLDRLREAVVDRRDGRVEQVAETEEHRQRHPAVAQPARDLVEADGPALPFGDSVGRPQRHGDLAVGRDAEMPVPPVGHPV